MKKENIKKLHHNQDGEERNMKKSETTGCLHRNCEI